MGFQGVTASCETKHILMEKEYDLQLELSCNIQFALNCIEIHTYSSLQN